MVVLALIKIAIADPDMAASQLESKWGPMLSRRGAQLAVGRDRPPGRRQALAGWPAAHFANVTKNADLTDDMLAWKARAALRTGHWKEVLRRHRRA